ncbi:MAG: MFS transporter, partial [Stackebrandtia sp.]
SDATVLAVAAAAVYGLGFGALQNDSMSVMFRRVGPGGHGHASVVWNVAYDGGTGLGGAAIGLVSLSAGLPGGFAVAAAAVALTLPVAWTTARLERRA